jgi:hypothetical protein
MQSAERLAFFDQSMDHAAHLNPLQIETIDARGIFASEEFPNLKTIDGMGRTTQPGRA